MRRPARQRSLRRLILQCTIAFGVVATLSTAIIASMSTAIRHSMDTEADQLTVDQRIADQIVSSSYEQQLAAYRYLAAPSAERRKEFYARGNVAYERIRHYLFRPMPLAARLTIETIKEAHQSFEVAAQRAFDLRASGEIAGQQQDIAVLTEDADVLERAVRSFIADRAQQLFQVRAAREAQLIGLQRVMVLLAVVLGLFAALMAVLLRRRVMVPIADLSVAVRELTAGTGLVRVAPQQYQEFQGLADSFDGMAARIRESREEVQARNRELVQTLEELEQAQRELVQHEKLSAMGEMLAGLAHELNNPLAGILGIAECLKADLHDSSDPIVRNLEVTLIAPLINESLRARDLVRNLLHFSRGVAPHLEPVLLSNAISVSVGLRRHAYTQRGVGIDIDVPEGCHVMAQQQKLELAIINIVNNALDAMVEGKGTRLRISGTCADDVVVLHFDDDGPGFVHPGRSFEPFYTTKAVGAGTGLGLSLVHRFMHEFGGSASAENLGTGGARVTLILRAAPRPDSDDAPVALAEAAEPLAAIPPTLVPVARPRILVVDDEPALRIVQRRLLARLDVDVDAVANGADACDAIGATTYDLVITDLRMPGKVGGRELLLWIEREHPELSARVIVVTGDTMGSHDGDVELPLDRVITKPFDAASYLERVQRVLDAEVPVEV
jgi:C4-dicarboxylate-specific signal transduction histidine kinase